MIVYVGLVLITVSLGFVVGKKGKIADRFALLGIFLLLSFVSVLRVNIGNDYGRYAQIFHELRYDGYVITEGLFNQVVAWIMKEPLWWEQSYQVVYGIFAVFTIGLFLKAIYDDSEDFGISFFLFMMLGLYFQTYSTMRYYFALALCVYAVRFLVKEQKKPVKNCVPAKEKGKWISRLQELDWVNYGVFICLILVAAGFHKSALVVIPMYFLARLPWDTWKHRKWVIVVFLLLCIQFFVLKDFYRDIMLRIYSSYEEEDALVQAKISYTNIARCLLVFLLCLPVYQDAIKGKVLNRFWFTCNVFALALYTFGYYVPIISRFGYFINIGQIFLVPACIKAIPYQKQKKWVTAFVIGVGMLFFIAFFRETRYSLAILPYETWAFTDMEPVKMPVYTLLGIE